MKFRRIFGAFWHRCKIWNSSDSQHLYVYLTSIALIWLFAILLKYYSVLEVTVYFRNNWGQMIWRVISM